MLFDCAPGAAWHSQKRLLAYYKHAARGLSTDFLLLCHTQDAFVCWAASADRVRHSLNLAADNFCRGQSIRRAWSRWQRLSSRERCATHEAAEVVSGYLKQRGFFLCVRARRARAIAATESHTAAIAWQRGFLWRRWRNATGMDGIRQQSREVWRAASVGLLQQFAARMQLRRMEQALSYWHGFDATQDTISFTAHRYLAQLGIERLQIAFDCWCGNADRKVRAHEARDFWLATMPPADPWTEVRRFIASWHFRKHKAFLRWSFQPIVLIWALLAIWRWRRRAAVLAAVTSLRLERVTLAGLGLEFSRWAKRSKVDAKETAVTERGSSRYVLHVKRRALVSFREAVVEAAYYQKSQRQALERAFATFNRGCSHEQGKLEIEELGQELEGVWGLGRGFGKWVEFIERGTLTPVFNEITRTWALGRSIQSWAKFLLTPHLRQDNCSARHAMGAAFRRRRTLSAWVQMLSFWKHFATAHALDRWGFSIMPPSDCSPAFRSRLGPLLHLVRAWARMSLRKWQSATSLGNAWQRSIVYKIYCRSWRANALALAEALRVERMRASHAEVVWHRTRKHAAILQWHRTTHEWSSQDTRMAWAANSFGVKRKMAAFAAFVRARSRGHAEGARFVLASARWRVTAGAACLKTWRLQKQRLDAVDRVVRLRRARGIRLWRSHTSQRIGSDRGKQVAERFATIGHLRRAWCSWRNHDVALMGRMAVAAATRSNLRAWKLAAKHRESERHQLDVAVTTYREAVMRWSLRRLEFHWRGVRRSDDARALPLVCWARRTPESYRPFSPSPFTIAPLASPLALREGTRWATRAEMVDFASRMLSRRRCMRRWAAEARTNRDLMGRADKLLPAIRGRALAVWQRAAQRWCAHQALMAVAVLAQLRCVWVRWTEVSGVSRHPKGTRKRSHIAQAAVMHHEGEHGVRPQAKTPQRRQSSLRLAHAESPATAVPKLG